ncbi:hypothetical protein ACI1MP_00475 [Kitasatospora griseola]|uniref:hypothetical protein n=1 Tax=Kitasatospora griseola TaxID=2064 RepID=UPI00385587DA
MKLVMSSSCAAPTCRFARASTRLRGSENRTPAVGGTGVRPSEVRAPARRGESAATPEARATSQQCVTAAVQSGVPAELAKQACSLAAAGDIDECVDLLGGLMPAPLAHMACSMATGLGGQPDQQGAGRVLTGS